MAEIDSGAAEPADTVVVVVSAMIDGDYSVETTAAVVGQMLGVVALLLPVDVSDVASCEDFPITSSWIDSLWHLEEMTFLMTVVLGFVDLPAVVAVAVTVSVRNLHDNTAVVDDVLLLLSHLVVVVVCALKITMRRMNCKISDLHERKNQMYFGGMQSWCRQHHQTPSSLV